MIAYCLITRIKVDIGEIIYSDLVTKLTSKSGKKYVSCPRFISCALEVLLVPEYTQDEKLRNLPSILSNSKKLKDPSKVTKIKLMASMIAVNKLETSVSPLHFSGKKNKGKSQTVSQPKPKTQGLDALGSLPQKRKQHKPKKSTPKTQATPPSVPIEESDKTS
ncbi:hypothetical protein Tco_1169835 [Tanacetum coccineum]